MAERKAAENEFNPRHRIVGAVILVALAVIFLPLVLNDRPSVEHPGSPRELVAPEAASTVPVPMGGPARTGPTTRVITVPVGPRAGQPSAEPVPPPAPDTGTTSTPPDVAKEPAAPAAQPAVSAKVDSAKPEKTRPATAGHTEKGKWVVQMGVFSQLENAKRLQEKLRKKGYTVKLDPSQASAGQTVRVEVGPYRDEAAAKTAAARLQSDVGIRGVVRQD